MQKLRWRTAGAAWRAASAALRAACSHTVQRGVRSRDAHFGTTEERVLRVTCIAPNTLLAPVHLHNSLSNASARAVSATARRLTKLHTQMAAVRIVRSEAPPRVRRAAAAAVREALRELHDVHIMDGAQLQRIADGVRAQTQAPRSTHVLVADAELWANLPYARRSMARCVRGYRYARVAARRR